jgi:hypothetical protein
MMKPAANDIIVTINDHNTLFFSVADESGGRGEIFADSSTMNRRRGVWSIANKRHADAPSLTPKKVRQYGAGLVSGYLELVGHNIDGRRVWFVDNNRAEFLGAAEVAA